MNFFSVPKRQACLGVTLASREFAIAVVREHRHGLTLPAYAITQFRNRQEKREELLEANLMQHIRRIDINKVFAVVHEPATEPVLALLGKLKGVCEREGIPVAVLGNASVRESLAERPSRVGNRDLGVLLQARLPELSAILPERLRAGWSGQLPRSPDSNERSWFRFYLAAAAAIAGIEPSNWRDPPQL